MNPNLSQTVSAGEQAPVSGGVALARPRFPWRLFFVVWLAALVMAALATWLQREVYVGVTRFVVLPESVAGGTNAAAVAAVLSHDPAFVAAQVEWLQSEAVLGRVAAELGLMKEWGQRFYAGQTLRVGECVGMLQTALRVEAGPADGVVTLRFYSDRREEAAVVANAVVRVYGDLRREEREARLRERLVARDRQLKELDLRLEAMKQKLLALPAGVEAEGTALDRAVAQKNFDGALALRQELWQRLLGERLEGELPRTVVQVLDAAMAPSRPFRPRVALNLWLGVGFGLLAGALVAGAVRGLQARAYQRRTGVFSNAHSPGLRNAVRGAVALVVGLMAGYAAAMPLDVAGGLRLGLVVVVCGLVLAWVELGNSKIQETPVG